MDKVAVRAKTLSRALFGLAVAGSEVVEISIANQAVRVEGKRPDGEAIVVHVWSRDAEDTEAALGKGEKLTEEEAKYLDVGKCPKCPEHGQLFKENKVGLAHRVVCDSGHIFLAPPAPFTPEYLGKEPLEGEMAEEPAPEPDTKEPPPPPPTKPKEKPKKPTEKQPPADPATAEEGEAAAEALTQQGGEGEAPPGPEEKKPGGDKEPPSET